MKSKLLSLIALAMVCFSTDTIAQTAGSLSVTYTQPIPTTPVPWNSTHISFKVCWIENSSGTFIKTNFYYNGKKDHFPTWAPKAGCLTTTATSGTPLTYYNAMDINCNKNGIDATTGATLSNGTFQTPATSNPKAATIPPAFGTITYTWDGKDSTGAIVPDGVYTAYIEASWSALPRATHDELYSFTFTKNGNINTVTPTPDTFINNVTAKWTPTALGTSDIVGKNQFKVSPNPANNKFSVQSNENIKGVNVFDIAGRLVKTYLKADSYDITSLKVGIYFLEINTTTGVAYQKLIKN